MYNLELEGADPKADDLFWVEQSTGLITHNCLPKDLDNLIHCIDAAFAGDRENAPSMHSAVTRAARSRNDVLDRHYRKAKEERPAV